jgi:ribosomal protein S18 acetylase RimI-like enzyme
VSAAATAEATRHPGASIDPDDWLGPLLGKPAYRVALDPGAGDALVPRLEEARRRGPAFFYAKLAPNQLREIHLLEARGFHLVDTNITLARPGGIQPGGETDRARFAVADDEDAVGRIARTNLSTSRFHLDPEIPRAVADTIKEEWARNFFRGRRGRWMVVAELEDGVAGFLQLLLDDHCLVIDLIAVDAPARRRGLARGMIEFAAAECRPFDELAVGTQLGNRTSLDFYESLGFRVVDARHVLHLHE